jgi:hypothetical protein
MRSLQGDGQEKVKRRAKEGQEKVKRKSGQEKVTHHT